MKIEDEKVEPASDLGLSLDYCNRYDQRTSNDDPGAGAGANAGSRVNMAFVSANPLTELVWSPHRGLSLKSADCSLTERKSSHRWGVGTSTSHDSLPGIAVAAPSSSIIPLDELNSTLPKNIVNEESDTIGESIAGKFSTWNTCFIPGPESRKEESSGNGDCPGDMIDNKHPTDVSLINKSIEGEVGVSKERYKYSASKVKESSLPDSAGQAGGISINSHMSVSFYGHRSTKEKKVDPTDRLIGMEIIPACENKLLNEHEDSDTPVSSQGKGKGKIKSASDISTLPRLDILETTAENNLQMCNRERTCDVAANVVAPESVLSGKTNSVEEREVKRTVAPNDSTGDGRFLQHHSKGKGMALSDGDLSGLPGKEDDDSYESVESCNSAGRFSSGKRRWSFEQQLIVGSKRAKQIEDKPGSSSVVKHGSSFMNWISSMMKGFANSNQDKEDLLVLGLSNPDQSRKESMEHSLPMDREIQPLSSRNRGFKSIFQSIYCPNKSAQEARMNLCNNVTEEAPMEIDQIGKRENSLELQSPKDNLCESETQNVVDSETLPRVSFGNFTVSFENHLSGPAKNKNSCMLGEDQAKKTVQSSSASPIMLKANPENDFSLAEERKTKDVSYRDGALGSLWIARFSSGASVSLLKQDVPDFHRDQVTVELKKGISQEFSNVAGNETKDCAVSNEGSTGLKKTEDLHDKNLFHSTREILPSRRVESSDAMASIFARRLDALKNIVPSHLIDSTSRVDTTCFFCGMKGHHLQNCSEISKAELENFLKNVKSYDNAWSSPRLCIRCFQLNHWASACPNAPHKEKSASSLPENIPRNSLNRSIRFEEVLNGHNMISNIDMKSYSNLSRKANHLSERQKKSSEKDLRLQIADVPKGIFAALKMLRLSRVDILKCMTSKISLSRLDGFFLRLRLSKWEEGHGATSYYVACISGMQKERSLKKAKSPISVSIRGIKCLVETQYISNQDFLEDELMAWWCTTSRGGDKIPSEEELKRKAEEKKKLGF